MMLQCDPAKLPAKHFLSFLSSSFLAILKRCITYLTPFLTIYSLTFTHSHMTPYLRFLHHPFFSSPSEYNMCNFKNWIGPRLVIVFPALVGNYNIIPLFWPWFSLIIRLLYILQLTHIDVTLAVFFLEDNLNLRLINDKKILTMIIHSGMIWQVLLKPRHPSVPVIITSDSTNHQPGSIVRPHVGHLSGLYITPIG